eukprot:CAMPEP_0201108898 /NCGR_PEP_ID=MMETSP0812-20130820/63512_1 /ASSEMBLY_ACC=CAM_ASM_000668 /TAXON_ID=98059 /ORGANISM="Dinobryon sp., Strain UTEXLB2267" /LENGTH=198 /DNA_ID=CAMNT_0047370573 /DNA_START=62 /DNA_END=655 /DNA_ORIENTATION=-
MLPTIDPTGELVLVDVISYQYFKKQFKAGDVVIAVSPYNPGRTICKRIHAVGGDTVAFYNKKYFRPEVVKVPDGHVWLLGDNQLNSHDSRNYGPVPTGLLVGKALFKFSLSNPFLTYQLEKNNQKIKNQSIHQPNESDKPINFDNALVLAIEEDKPEDKDLPISVHDSDGTHGNSEVNNTKERLDDDTLEGNSNSNEG